MNRPQRKRVLSENLQYRLLAFNLVYFFVIVFISAATLFLPVMIELKIGTESPLEKEEVAGEFLALHSRAWPPLFIVFVLLGLHSVLVSHRIAGPLQRFRGAMKAVGEGNLAVQVALRRNDYLGTETDILNEMAATLRRRVRAIQDQHDEVRRLFEEVKRAAASGSAAELRTIIGGLATEMEQLKKCLDQFTTGAPEVGDDQHPLPKSGGGRATRDSASGGAS